MHAIQLPPQSQLLRAPFRRPSFLSSLRWPEEIWDGITLAVSFNRYETKLFDSMSSPFWNLVFSENHRPLSMGTLTHSF